jgi:hypothetical protein
MMKPVKICHLTVPFSSLRRPVFMKVYEKHFPFFIPTSLIEISLTVGLRRFTC